MANILYGVNGEGSGHSTRSKEVIKHLLSRGHSVHVASFDRGMRNLSADFPVTEIYGLRFAYVENQVRYRKTVIKNLVTIPGAAKSLKRLSRLADEWAIDLVCTDFEPLSYRLGKHRKLPVISIDNQHVLTHARIRYPREFRKDAATAKLVTRLLIPHATEYLITTFFSAQLKRRRGMPGAAHLAAGSAGYQADVGRARAGLRHLAFLRTGCNAEENSPSLHLLWIRA